MTDKQRYGVFRLGQIWSVVSSTGRAIGFPTRARAVVAAHTLASEDMALGGDAVVVLQDDLGRLTTVAPVSLVDVDRDEEGRGVPLSRWGARRRPRRSSAKVRGGLAECIGSGRGHAG